MWVNLLAVAASAAGIVTVRVGASRPYGPGRWRRLPETWLVLVCALVFANQVLVNVYVIRAHHGDPSYIARYLPGGWFTLVDGRWMRALASWFPVPGVLSVTILRTQAFLELPFGLLIYLTAARWLDPALMRRLCAGWTLAAASMAYTIVFCLIEADLANPYTRDDIAVRAVAAVVTPLILIRVLRAGDDPPVRSMAQALAFAAAAGGLGVMVLVLYDTLLLYSLGRFGREAPIAGAALAVLIAARLAARRIESPPAGPCLTTLVRTAWLALAWFFTPALPIRYALLGYGSRPLAAALVALIVIVAVIGTTRDAPAPPRLLRLAAVLLVAALAAGAAMLVPMPHIEGRLLLAMGAFLAVAMGGAVWLDRKHRS